MKRSVGILLVVATLSSTAIADVIHLKGGRTIEGTVVEETKTEVTIKTKFGTQKFKPTDILKVEKKATKQDEYRERLSKIDAKDADGFYRLGLWCQTEKLSAEATKAFKEAIRVDPDHEGARTALGYVKYEGVWVTKTQKEAEESANKSREMQEQGLVLYKGQWVKEEDLEQIKSGKTLVDGKWVTPEEKAKIDKGLVEVDGSWIPKDEAENRAKGLFLVEGKWVDKPTANAYHGTWDTAWQLQSDHYALTTDTDYDSAKKILEMAEKTYEKLKEFFGEEPDLHGDRLRLWVFSDAEDYNSVGSQSATGLDAFHQSNLGSFYAAEHPDTPVMIHSFYDENYRFDWTDYYLYHSLPHQFMAEVQPNITSAWLAEGIAFYFQFFVFYKWNSLRKDWGTHVIGNRFIPLEELVETKSLGSDPASGFYVGGDKQRQQAAASLLILYITDLGPQEYKDRWKKFLEKVKRSSDDNAVFQGIFKVNKLDRDFAKWIEDLK